MTRTPSSPTPSTLLMRDARSVFPQPLGPQNMKTLRGPRESYSPSRDASSRSVTTRFASRCPATSENGSPVGVSPSPSSSFADMRTSSSVTVCRPCPVAYEMAYSSVSISRAGDAVAASDAMPTPSTIALTADADTLTSANPPTLACCHSISMMTSSGRLGMSMRAILSIVYGSRSAMPFAPFASDITITLTPESSTVLSGFLAPGVTVAYKSIASRTTRIALRAFDNAAASDSVACGTSCTSSRTANTRMPLSGFGASSPSRHVAKASTPSMRPDPCLPTMSGTLRMRLVSIMHMPATIACRPIP